MTIQNIDIDATLNKVKTLLVEEKELSPTMRSMVELLVLLVTLLANSLNLNSSNSSKPPSSDPNRKKVRRRREVKKQADKKAV